MSTEFKIRELIGEPTDYSDKGCWLAFPEITHAVDTIYIYPTVYVDASEDAPPKASIDNEIMTAGAQKVYESQATVFEESTNVFVPYYRQSNLIALQRIGNSDAVIEFQMQEQRTDLYAALDYYFENCNKGRPFILAGHSQGSIMIIIILDEYMQAHPEYYERMIVAYPIGYSITHKWLREHPYVKFAEGAEDTGVIASWNTEGPGNKGHLNSVVEPGTISINPLNWKRDATYADLSENLGSLVRNAETGKYEIVAGLGDAQLDIERGVVVCTTYDSYMSREEIFGPQSLHNYDYTLYYVNLRQNVKDRINSYFNK